MNNIIIENAKSEVIDIEILKAHLRIAHSLEDDYLKRIIPMATAIFESQIEKSLLKKKYCFVFNCDFQLRQAKIELPAQPVLQICSAKKLCNEPSNKNIAFTEQHENGKTYLEIFGSKYPIEIQYYAGMFEKAKFVPEEIKYAILQIAKNIYEASDEDFLKTKLVKQIINSYREFSIA